MLQQTTLSKISLPLTISASDNLSTQPLPLKASNVAVPVGAGAAAVVVIVVVIFFTVLFLRRR